MKTIRLTGALALVLATTACGSFEAPTRNAPLDVAAFAEGQTVVTRSYRPVALNYMVPEDLSVSERNSYYPFADIVWRGDPLGDRKAQIGAMFREAVDRNSTSMSGAIPVVIDVHLARFHGVTERTRFSVGGIYHIVFEMTVRHAETGEVIEAPRRVTGELSAPGGDAAVLAEHRGQTEKVRVTDFLTLLLRDELSGEVVL